MRSHHLRATFSDSLIENAWIWFFVIAGLALIIALKDTSAIWNKIKKSSGVNRFLDVSNLVLHWLAVVVSIAGGVISQIGSNRSDTTIGELKKVNTNLSQRVIISSNELSRIKAQGTPRVGSVSKIDKELAGKPTGEAEILFLLDDESEEFAGWMKALLLHAKWKISEPRPIGDEVSGSFSGFAPDEIRHWSAAKKLGASGEGISIIGNEKTLKTFLENEINPLRGLYFALARSNIKVAIGHEDKSLPDGFLRIVIAPR
jgi:hypothetical protein